MSFTGRLGEVVHAQQGRDRGPVHVRVHDPDARTGLGQRDGEVGRHRRLADATFAAGDRDDVFDGGDQLLLHLAGRRPHAGRHADLHGRDAGQGGDRALRLLLHLLAHGAGRGGELDAESDRAVHDPHVLDEPERDDVAPQVRVANDAQRVEDLAFGDYLAAGRLVRSTGG